MTRPEAVAHAATLAAGVAIPVSADLEDGFGDAPGEVAATVRAARQSGLAGCSIEDYTRDPEDPIYDLGLARERIAAAVEESGGPDQMVLTARADGHLHGIADLRATIARLQAFQDAGADVLYAPGVRKLDEVRAICGEVDRPVNVLLLPDGPSPAELAEAGAARMSVGAAWTWVAYTALLDVAQDLLDGRADYFGKVEPSRKSFMRGGNGQG